MTDQANTPDLGAFEGTSPASAHSVPAAKAAPASQHALDREGVPRWNAEPDPTGETARWRQQQRERLGDTDPAAAKPDKAVKDGAADKSHKFGDTTVSEAELQEFLTNKAARESGKLRAPATPDEYKLELPADWVAPAGIEVALDKNDPVLGKLRGWAAKYQLPQEAVSEVLGLYAGKIAGDLAVGQSAHLAEVEKLGTTGPARVDAIALWLKGQLGDQGKVLSGQRGPDGFVRNGVLWTADVCQAFEALMSKHRGGGGGGYRPGGSDNGPADGKIPGYEKMSFEQRRHAQEQRRAR